MRAALLAALLLLSACATRWSDPAEVHAGEDGTTAAVVQIESSPTEAWIFVDGVYIGTTPLEHELSFSSRVRYLEVAAVPIYDGQARQVKRIQVPPLPKRLHFNMNNPR